MGKHKMNMKIFFKCPVRIGVPHTGKPSRFLRETPDFIALSRFPPGVIFVPHFSRFLTKSDLLRTVSTRTLIQVHHCLVSMVARLFSSDWKSERVFSMGRKIVTENRTRMDNSSMASMVFLGVNLTPGCFSSIKHIKMSTFYTYLCWLCRMILRWLLHENVSL